MTRATSANSGQMVEGAAPAVEPTGDPEPESAVEAARRLTRAMEFNDSFHDSIEYNESEPAVEGTGPMVETVDSPGDAAPLWQPRADHLAQCKQPLPMGQKANEFSTDSER